MIFKTTEELSDFTRKRWKKSGKTIREISRLIGKDERQLAKAVQKSERSNKSRNGIRRELLCYLGFDLNVIYSVIRQKKT